MHVLLRASLILSVAKFLTLFLSRVDFINPFTLYSKLSKVRRWAENGFAPNFYTVLSRLGSAQALNMTNYAYFLLLWAKLKTAFTSTHPSIHLSRNMWLLTLCILIFPTFYAKKFNAFCVYFFHMPQFVFCLNFEWLYLQPLSKVRVTKKEGQKFLKIAFLNVGTIRLQLS